MNKTISSLTRTHPRLLSILTACLGLTLMANAAPQTWSVTSPNGAVKISVQLAELDGQKDFPAGTKLYYRVEHGPEGSRATVIADAPLGLQLRGQDFAQGLSLTTAGEPQLIEERYTLLHGKRRECANRANQITLAFRNAAGRPLELDLRAYDNGAAFRYRLSGEDNAPLTLDAELTGFALPSDAKLWAHPAAKPTRCTLRPTRRITKTRFPSARRRPPASAGRIPCSSAPATASTGR